MGVMCQVARVLAKNPGSIQPAQFRLKFGMRDEPPETAEQKKASQEIAVAHSKAKVIFNASHGGKRPVEIVGKDGQRVVIPPRRVPGKGTEDRTIKVPRKRST